MDDEANHQIYGELFDKCFCCIFEHPALLKDLGSKKVKSVRTLRRALSIKYDT